MKNHQENKSQGRLLSAELPLRILIAEDNLINQKLLLSILELQGYHPEAVTDGLDVLRTLKEKAFDLVLMDIQMPEMGGEETTKAIREQFKNDTPKIIAVTAYAMAGDRERYLQAGMNGYISKPFKIDDLVNEIRKVMLNK
ncbi:MAG: response regulator [Chitinophagales bacterium]